MIFKKLDGKHTWMLALHLQGRAFAAIPLFIIHQSPNDLEPFGNKGSLGSNDGVAHFVSWQCVFI